MLATVDKPFSCSDVHGMLTKNLVALSKLKYTNMAIQLVANGVISMDEKEVIDGKTSTNQMAEIIKIVQDGLLGNKTKKYKGFLLAMEQSQDGDLKDQAKDLGERTSNLCTYNYLYMHHIVYVKSFEGENFCSFRGFLLTANVLPLKIFLAYQHCPLTTKSMVLPCLIKQ